MEYQKSQLCVIPYTKGTAGFQAAIAMANSIPVIATRRAGTQDHLGDTAMYVREHSAIEIADAIEKLLGNESLRRELGDRARKRAIELLDWNVLASKTLHLYEEARTIH
jgi:glycosyltransferase involved in cell wall biosynthesis